MTVGVTECVEKGVFKTTLYEVAHECESYAEEGVPFAPLQKSKVLPEDG